MNIGLQDMLLFLTTFILVLIGLGINVYNIFSREKSLYQDEANKNSQLTLNRALIGHFLFFVGILLTTNFVSHRKGSDYNYFLDIVSFLSAGVIAGYYAHDPSKYSKNIRHITIRITICFQIIFYSLFTSIAFFMARSNAAQKSDFGNILIPIIMLIILITNSYYEYAIFLTQKEKNQTNS